MNDSKSVTFDQQRSVSNKNNHFADKIKSLIPQGYELIPQLNEVYELQLALMEADVLSPDGVLDRGAYFQSINGNKTKHFLMCSGDPLSITMGGDRRRNFFKNNAFKTGYATHGFFPYRGKFHPQMIKALINIMGMKPGNIILDPMMGSGTTLIEAATMGIDSVGFDLSPFCNLMAQAKLDGLGVDVSELLKVISSNGNLEKYADETQNLIKSGNFDNISPSKRVTTLAYLDAVGLSRRNERKTLKFGFREIMSKYVGAISKFQKFVNNLRMSIGDGKCKVADARKMPLDSESIDGIIFSPPYSFAIDYIENDITQLQMMKTNIPEMRSKLTGLRGRKGVEQVNNYRADIDRILSECARVLKQDHYCLVVVGTNSNQLNALRKRVALRDLEHSLEEMFTKKAIDAGLTYQSEIKRQITGIANTMREESILVFKR
ncbi:hypothetical protein JW979_03290 [bacterium]|nr:hypothetical protein [candidate division CSSED10-310 bacterium]